MIKLNVALSDCSRILATGADSAPSLRSTSASATARVSRSTISKLSVLQDRIRALGDELSQGTIDQILGMSYADPRRGVLSGCLNLLRSRSASTARTAWTEEHR